jgi:hypothetical protein
MKCSKKIFVEWKKNRSVWISTHTPPHHKKYFARSNVGADRSPLRIARSNRTLFKKILNTIRSERRYEVAFRKVRNQKNFFQKNKISKSDARSEARRTHLGCQTIDPKRLEKIRPKGSGPTFFKEQSSKRSLIEKLSDEEALPASFLKLRRIAFELQARDREFGGHIIFSQKEKIRASGHKSRATPETCHTVSVTKPV